MKLEWEVGAPRAGGLVEEGRDVGFFGGGG